MSSWRDQILREFIPNVARLTIVADLDGLLMEEGILEGVRKRGFEMIAFDDHIAFRFAYESKFRSRWDRGEQTDLVVLLRLQTNDLISLPHDLLLAGRRLSFNLADIFPNLSYSVVAALDRSDLDTLHEAHKRYAPGPLGDNATKEFVLRHVFEIAPELIKQPSDLLRILLRRHYRGRRIPTILDERFIQLLRQNDLFDEWPLEKIVADRETFLTFLQERWPIFLNCLALNIGGVVCEAEKSYQLAVSGPIDLPFGHDDIRAYVDNLFVEGLMHPVAHEHATILSDTWVVSGIRTVPIEDRYRRIGKLIESLQTSIPADDAKYTDWFNFARGWAELICLMAEPSETLHEDTDKNATSLRVHVDAEFSAWLLKRYAGLINLPPMPPVMLHHLPRFLDRQMAENRDLKIALIVMDGLAMDQWLVVRGVLASKQASLRFREHGVFAWIPSLTSVSRQAAFSGRPPMFFPNSIYSTDKEPALWMQFWADQGFAPNEISYMKGLGDGDFEAVSEVLSHPKARVAGLVVDKVDRIMHGMELGTAGMHNQVRQWAERGYMNSLLTLLLDRNFRVYLTSDHGNVEAMGCGRPAEGAFADLRGERVRVYPDVALRDNVKARFPDALEWPTIGLPENYLPLLAPARQAFIQESERTVTHGGISVEELIVPLVQIERSAE
jgi:hypothetical protein